MPRAAPYNRDDALERAMHLFWRQGYHATSLKDLEAALQMRPGSIYAAFQSKDALFRLALARYREMNLRDFEQITTAASSPLNGLGNYLRALARCSEDGTPSPTCMLARTMLELSDTPGAAGAEARAYLRQMADQFCGALDRAKTAGQLSQDADTARIARKVQAKVMGLSVYLQRDQDPDMLGQLADDLACEIEGMAVVSASRGADTATVNQTTLAAKADSV